MRRVDKEAMRLATMACWWPSPVYHPQRVTNWREIANELRLLGDGAICYHDNQAEAAEYFRLAKLAEREV